MPREAFLENLRERLRDTQARGLTRSLQLPSGVDFSSNDYLGLAGCLLLQKETLARVMAAEGEPLSAPASRLLRGHLPAHARLETRLARFKQTEKALLFSSGYMANVGLLTALVRTHDRVISDAQNHASIIDAIRLTAAHKVIFPHLDMDALAAALRVPHPDGVTYVVTESLFSMDGDVAPLPKIASLCERYGAALIVDDAHGIGLFGQRLSGLVEQFGLTHQVLASVSTFGKALGASGACIAGPAEVIETVINHGRSFVFTTALAPLLVHLIDAALDRIDMAPELAEHALRHAQTLRGLLTKAGLNSGNSVGPVVPVILGGNEVTMEAAAMVQARGYDVRGIRPPTVAPGTARLRICVHANHTARQIDGVGRAVIDAVHALNYRLVRRAAVS